MVKQEAVNLKLRLKRFKQDIRKKYMDSTAPKRPPEGYAVFIFLNRLKLGYTKSEFT